MGGLEAIKILKREIDVRNIQRMTDLIDYVVNQENIDLYYMLTDNDIFELLDSYIEKKKSIYNRNIIKKYYMEMGANLIE